MYGNGVGIGMVIIVVVYKQIHMDQIAARTVCYVAATGTVMLIIVVLLIVVDLIRPVVEAWVSV